MSHALPALRPVNEFRRAERTDNTLILMQYATGLGADGEMIKAELRIGELSKFLALQLTKRRRVGRRQGLREARAKVFLDQGNRLQDHAQWLQNTKTQRVVGRSHHHPSSATAVRLEHPQDSPTLARPQIRTPAPDPPKQTTKPRYSDTPPNPGNHTAHLHRLHHAPLLCFDWARHLDVGSVRSLVGEGGSG